MDDRQIRRILRTARVIATVGFSTDPEKPSHQIPAYLQDQGYRVIPVHPRAGEIRGQRAYPDLRSVPEPVDVVQIFRPADEVPAIVEEAIEIGARAVWMQEGIVHPEAAARARQAGLEVVMDRCMRVEHRRMKSHRSG